MSEDKALVGKGMSGNFVHDNQDMAADDGFKNVSQLWYDKTISIDDGIEAVEKIKANRADLEENMGDIVIGHDGPSIVVMIDGGKFTPTAHALRQLGTWLDTPHTLLNFYTREKVAPNGKIRYARDERDADLIVRALRLGQSRVKSEKPMLFRTYKDGTLRAVLSDRYAIIDNRWYLEVLKAALPEGRLSHWRGDADTLWGNVLIPDTLRADTDSDYGGMLSLSNCEIGLRRLAQYPSLFRAICMNGCIWDQTKGNVFTQIHRGEIKLDDLRKLIFENINKQIPLMADHVTRFLSMRDRKLTAPVKNLFAQLSLDNGFTNVQTARIATEFVQYEKGDRNAFGIINAITRAGQAFDNEDWFRFDGIAGSLFNMTPAKWEAFNGRAAMLDDETVADKYMVSA